MDVIFIIHVGTSKAGVDMLSKVMALELGQHKVEQLCCTAMIHTLSKYAVGMGILWTVLSVAGGRLTYTLIFLA